MTTTKKAAPVAKAEAEAPAETPAEESKPERTRASDLAESVFEAIRRAGPEGITLKGLEESTGIRYRVLHNVVWHLGLNPKVDEPRVQKVGDGRKLTVAAVEGEPAKPARKPRTSSTRKPGAKSTTRKASPTKAA